MKNILHITPNFNYSCGRSKLAFMYLKHFSNTKDFQIHFITNGGDSLDRLRVLPSLKYKQLNFSTGFKNIFYRKSFYNALKGYVKENNISLIHTHHRFPESAAVKISRELNVRTVTSAHSFVKGLKGWGFNSDKVIAVSNSVRNYIMNDFKVSAERILTLYNPIEKSQEKDEALLNLFRTEKEITDENKIILFVGRICPDKGFDQLIKAFELIRTKNKNAILVIVGQFEGNKNVYESFLNSERVIYIPPQRNIQNFYDISDFVVLPSRVDPFPFVMLEAGCFKKPFIGGNTGGIAEFIEDGENGLLVDPENPQMLAEKIIYLLNNPQIGKTMGEKLYEKVNRLCDYNSYFSEVEKIYNSLLNRE
ncbi:MAG: glycosyltransferase family 4 protein [Ignavibacteriaceae bacterium]|nr:glycosyltransferase family 4 protein [Ignavibacteriaceae bacterium]